MPGQPPQILGVHLEAVSKYETARREAEAKIAALVGKTVLIKDMKGSGSVNWKVIQSRIPENVLPENDEKYKYGIKNFSVSNNKNQKFS